MITKKYNIINNAIGWIVFAIALATYWLTLEPTASYWDCGEFIIQASKLEVGHPPGNPIFMLTARFFTNFAPDTLSIPLMVNAMSGLLSALTILLLFWTVTHLVRRLIVKDDEAAELPLAKYLLIMGSGVVGALAYCWSDTFWFSAVEGEVYAFSSFCTAVVFWLILKWENRADQPHSDRYLILIAYVIGISIAVHLLNLLCIPAIVLVFAYRKYKDMNVKKSLLALAISFVIIAFVLFGLVPGFVKMAQQAELFFVNSMHLSFNSGVLIYTFVTAAAFIWGIAEIMRFKSAKLIKISFLVAVTLSGILFVGSGWWLGWLLTAVLAAWLFVPMKKKGALPLRWMNIALWSIAVIFVGYSSYALILIRSTADTPMNQNSPDNVFDLASYLGREQYGENPLLYGETLYSGPQKKQVGMRTDTVTYSEDGRPIVASYPEYKQVVNKGKVQWAKGVPGASPTSEYGFLTESDRARNEALAQRGGDYYVKRDYRPEIKNNPELDMLFPRIYSRMHAEAYKNWVNLDTTAGNMKDIYAIDEATGQKVPEVDLYAQPYMNPMSGMVNYPPKTGYRPTYAQNLEYFFNYQLMHMYMRYFMWNFAGRQNDILNQRGELDAGNWISGIPFIDNARLGDQSLLPDDLGKDNPGHNVFYMLPLFLGIIGLLWQSFAGKRGVEQFWVVFFLFFMTGIAIVLYLNQPPSQPRERDYAFAGSFYAYAIWIGMGVAGLAAIIQKALGDKLKNVDATAVAGIAVALGLVIPVQMVSQTWDDHDRSGRYAARDFAENYLNSLEPNAIVFCNGDNDTFPLWYAQEVEGVRPDVKIVNLSYLTSDWYANQMRRQSYTAAPISFTAKPEDIAYGKADVTLPGRDKSPVDLLTTLKALYAGKFSNTGAYPMLPSSVVTIPVNREQVIKRGLVSPRDTSQIVDEIVIDLANTNAARSRGYLSLGELLMLDIVATNAAEGWKRPIYWCSTVGNEYHLGLTDYLRSTGMTHQLVPTRQSGLPARTDRAYDVVMKYKWGGADVATKEKHPYYDETARRMLVTTRSSMMDVASELVYEGDRFASAGRNDEAKGEYLKAVKVLDTMTKKLSENTAKYGVSVALTVPEIYGTLGTKLNDPKLTAKAREMLWNGLQRFAQYARYANAMQAEFGNVAMTYESQLMPYQLYRFVTLYEQYGGDSRKLDAMLRSNGLDRNQLKRMYEAAYGGGGDTAGGQQLATDDASRKQYVDEMGQLATIVNRLAGMSADEYARQSSDDRYYDSIFYQAYQMCLGQGISESDLQKNPEVKKVDMARSRRLSSEYEAKHPN